MGYFPSSSASFQPVISEAVNAVGEQPFVGEIIAPVLGVATRQGKYTKVEANQFNNDLSKPRAAGSNFAQATSEYTSQSFDCIEYGIENVIDDIQIAEAETDAQFDIIASASLQLRDSLRIGHEIRVANLLSGAGFDSTAATAAMSDATNATPIADINAAVMRLNGKGIQNNLALIIEASLYQEMLQTDDLRNLINGSGALAFSTDQVSRVLGVDSVVLCNTRYNSAAKGQTASMAKVWPTSSYYVAQTQGGSISSDGVARTMVYTERGGAFVSETFRTEQPPANVVRVRMSADEVIMNVNAGEEITGA